VETQLVELSQNWDLLGFRQGKFGFHGNAGLPIKKQGFNMISPLNGFSFPVDVCQVVV